MSTMTYAEQLKHPFWQRKRLECLAEARWECASCGASDATLHVHHKRYVKGRKAWEYESSELQVLCETCHKRHHEMRELLEEILTQPDVSLEGAIGLLAGFFSTDLSIDKGLSESAKKVAGYEFLLGAFACIASGAKADAMAAAARGICKGRSLNPAERWVIELWEEGN